MERKVHWAWPAFSRGLVSKRLLNVHLEQEYATYVRDFPVLLGWAYGELVEALTLQPSVRLIGIGMWLALIMAFNVWFIIWPNHTLNHMIRPSHMPMPIAVNLWLLSPMPILIASSR